MQRIHRLLEGHKRGHGSVRLRDDHGNLAIQRQHTAAEAGAVADRTRNQPKGRSAAANQGAKGIEAEAARRGGTQADRAAAEAEHVETGAGDSNQRTIHADRAAQPRRVSHQAGAADRDAAGQAAATAQRNATDADRATIGGP